MRPALADIRVGWIINVELKRSFLCREPDSKPSRCRKNKGNLGRMSDRDYETLRPINLSSSASREECEDILALRGPSAALDPSDGGVAVLDGKRKITLHERRAHPLEFAHGYTPAEHQGFSAPTDRAIEGFHAYFACARRSYIFPANLDLSGSAIP